MTTELKERLDDLEAARQQRKVDAGERYHALVVTTANGTTTTPEDAAQVLDDAGKRPEELAADCQKYLDRKSLRAALDAGPAATKKAIELEAQLRDRRDKLAALVGKHRAEISVLETEFAAASDRVSQARSAERDLVNGAWSFVVAKERDILAALRDLKTMADQLDDRIRSMTGTKLTAERLLRDQPHATKENKAHNQAVVNHQVKEIARLQAELATIGKRRQALDAALQRVHAEKLEP